MGMVRLINGENIHIFADATYAIMHLQEFFTHIIEINNPNLTPCIYAMWHANQFLVYGIRNREKLSIQVSNSMDGEIISRVIQKMGFKTVRGSAGRKGAVSSTMQMISLLENNECVGIMVDGPRGPYHKVKNGAVKLAQMTGAPIVPVHWYSSQKTFITLPSWDKMKTPFFDCNIINVYGKPIYVNKDADDQEINIAKENIKQQLLELEEKAPELYKEAVKNKLWAKQ